jgi:hypothetical protein
MAEVKASLIEMRSLPDYQGEREPAHQIGQACHRGGHLPPAARAVQAEYNDLGSRAAPPLHIVSRAMASSVGLELL